MRKLLSGFMRYLSGFCLRRSRWLYQSDIEKAYAQFWQDDGYMKHRLSYDLTPDSLVFDLGGFKGQWSSDIFAMYRCTIHIFEPVHEFADLIESRFARNNRVHVHRFGLSNETKKALISVEGDSSSIFRKGTAEIELVRAADFLTELGIGRIDLMKINIEGGEYDLLEHFLSSAMVNIIDNIQVQFHDIVPNARDRRLSIQRELAKTHRLTYEYPLVFENWRLVKIQNTNNT